MRPSSECSILFGIKPFIKQHQPNLYHPKPAGQEHLDCCFVSSHTQRRHRQRLGEQPVRDQHEEYFLPRQQLLASSIMADAGGVSSQQPLYVKYPISSQWEFTLKNGQSFKGEVYCTDPVADLVILQDAQNDIRMISVSSIDAATRDEASEDSTIQQKKVEAVHAKKALEEREKRAIRMAQESLMHVNPKVRRSEVISLPRTYNNYPPSKNLSLNQCVLLLLCCVAFVFLFRVNDGGLRFVNLAIGRQADARGQLVFDRLLKACNEVVWKNESIIVLDSIKVDPPYTQEDCKLVASGQQGGSLDRVQKIVSSVTTA
jgi:hypothetical protein